MKEMEHWRRTLQEHIRRAIGFYRVNPIPFVVSEAVAQQSQTEAVDAPEAAET